MIAKPLVIYAPNVGAGGGLVLLRELLAATWPVPVTAILDQRARTALGKVGDAVAAHWAEPSVGGRWRAERRLADLTKAGTTVLCFHNLPPILARRGQVFCYVQNAYVIGLIPTAGLGMRLRARIRIERLIARRFRHRVDRYVVQTATMADALRHWYGDGVPPVDVLPFVATDLLSGAQAGARSEQAWDFLCVADGSLHKNHRGLFAAWRLLAEEGIRPSLAVTLHPERDAALRDEIRELAATGLRIVDLGQLPHAEILAAYRRAGALIFPSYAESFGIPLLEAQAAGLPILASERDYVRDVCDPAETFDPASPRSIARAVRRFLGCPARRGPLLSGEAFVTRLCDLAARNKA